MITTLKQTRVFQELNHWRKLLSQQHYRRNHPQVLAHFEEFCRNEGGLGLKCDLLPRGVTPKTALIVGHQYPPTARVEAWMIKVLQMAGFQSVVLGNRRYDYIQYYWLAGTKTVLDYSDFAVQEDLQWVDQQMDSLLTLQDWLRLEYEGVHVGRFALASAVRYLRTGQLNFADPSIRETLRQRLETSVRYAVAGIRLLGEIKPDCMLLMDRGYSASGELFDLALNRGIDTITWNLGYKSNRLLFKRYHSGNEREHPRCFSAESWRRICSIAWTPERGREIREELFQCYQTQDWFSLLGTQFDKEILSQQMTMQKLGLSSDKKIAVIFPHILWDGSFFWGEDLFDDYTDWFVETIRAACANPRLQWVVKIHPAHVLKAKIMKFDDRPAEVKVIEKAFQSLPAHVKLIYPESELSTYSLFQIADYAVTVRGTVGMEAALFGVPAVTAGTGRYDRRGFTLDSSTRQEYLQKLSTLETYPRLSAEQVELAERFAYGVFLCRELSLSSASLEYGRNGMDTTRFAIHCKTRQQWQAAPDVRQLASWLADGKAEDMLVLPGQLDLAPRLATSSVE